MTAALPRPDRSIVLVGLMGAGKSTVGRRLAHRLGLPFADSDEEIERAAGRTISDIFERFGETEFRDGERRVIARLVEGRPKVIATGGGAFMNAETRSLVLEKCIAVWLDADIATLAERVSRRDTRPLVSGKDPFKVLQDLAERRNPYYAEAHVHVRSETLPHDRAVEKILAAIDRRQNEES
jgi:shikimate kinase